MVPAAVFKLGPLHLLDVALTDVAVRQIFLLGQTYRGAFQSLSYAAYDTIRPFDPATVQIARSISETLRVSPGDFAFAIPERAVTLSLATLRDITHTASTSVSSTKRLRWASSTGCAAPAASHCS